METAADVAPPAASESLVAIETAQQANLNRSPSMTKRAISPEVDFSDWTWGQAADDISHKLCSLGASVAIDQLCEDAKPYLGPYGKRGTWEVGCFFGSSHPGDPQDRLEDKVGIPLKVLLEQACSDCMLYDNEDMEKLIKILQWGIKRAHAAIRENDSGVAWARQQEKYAKGLAAAFSEMAIENGPPPEVLARMIASEKALMDHKPDAATVTLKP